MWFTKEASCLGDCRGHLLTVPAGPGVAGSLAWPLRVAARAPAGSALGLEVCDSGKSAERHMLFESFSKGSAVAGSCKVHLRALPGWPAGSEPCSLACGSLLPPDAAASAVAPDL